MLPDLPCWMYVFYSGAHHLSLCTPPPQPRSTRSHSKRGEL
eukprot:IDg15609t1